MGSVPVIVMVDGKDGRAYELRLLYFWNQALFFMHHYDFLFHSTLLCGSLRYIIWEHFRCSYIALSYIFRDGNSTITLLFDRPNIKTLVVPTLTWLWFTPVVPELKSLTCALTVYITTSFIFYWFALLNNLFAVWLHSWRVFTFPHRSLHLEIMFEQTSLKPEEYLIWREVQKLILLGVQLPTFSSSFGTRCLFSYMHLYFVVDITIVLINSYHLILYPNSTAGVVMGQKVELWVIKSCGFSSSFMHVIGISSASNTVF